MRHLCVHGHFYQPARENPWTDLVEQADAAAPYHDWNERITAECYARNGASRLLDERQRIRRIVNNYAKISFNVGPTLLRWLARHAPATYEQILDADRSSRRDHYGHGHALAQVYNHLIMPLATARDRVTQVRWGIREFERRFRRRPEGIWLPETAVDLETLEILAAHGLTFTILAPHQAARVRRGEGPWTPVTAETLDVTVPYRCRLPSGRSIALVFFHGMLSRAVAFEGLLHDGAAFADRLAAAMPDDPHPRLLLVATDGETFGHHHRFGEMALTYALERAERQHGLRLSNVAAFLAAHPPVHEVEIVERTSWSCPHGIERWRADCGCRAGTAGHQRWRAPLREAISWLTGELAAAFELHGEGVLRDVWAARDEAVDLLDASPTAADAFLGRHGREPRDPARRAAALRLLEMQRQAMLMQSSDGWFFDDIAGPETVQILSHAARAVELARAFGVELEGPFVERLRAAPGNDERWPDGAVVYERLVLPRAVGPRQATACYAMTSLVGARSSVLGGAITVTELGRRSILATRSYAVHLGRVRVQTTLTAEEQPAAYALIHIGGHEVHCAVGVGWTEDRLESLRASLETGGAPRALGEVLRAIDVAFGRGDLSLLDLPLEDRRTVLARLTEQTLRELEETYGRLYRENRPLMAYLREVGAEVPAPLVTAAVVALTRQLEDLLAADGASRLSPRAFEVLGELRSWGREVRADRFEPLLRRRLEHTLGDAGVVADRVARALEILDFADAAGITLNLWEAQNAFHRLARAAGDPQLRTLGERLHFAMDTIDTMEV
ncbi:MAG TPA: DUF3536 domain-containing protein [bacterium]|nr:DUF3536 domain-containing protein [bacterium]